MTPLVIVPARVGSKGVPNKNFEKLPDGSTLWGRAVEIGLNFGHVVVTTDHPELWREWPKKDVALHRRDPSLGTDKSTMADVVRDVLTRFPGPPEQRIILLQPTTPFRSALVVAQCLARLDGTVDSVTSVYEVPEAFRPSRVLVLSKYDHQFACPVNDIAENRQTAAPAYVRDGQCYAARRYSLAGSLEDACFSDIVIVSEPTLNIDTMDDWEEACRRIRQTSASGLERHTSRPRQ